VGCDAGHEELSKVGHEQAHQPALCFCSVIPLPPAILQFPDRLIVGYLQIFDNSPSILRTKTGTE
jgi:hypothetical protein